MLTMQTAPRFKHNQFPTTMINWEVHYNDDANNFTVYEDKKPNAQNGMTPMFSYDSRDNLYCLTNFFTSPNEQITFADGESQLVQGGTYNSAEQCFQAQKFQKGSDGWNAVLAAQTPGQALKAGSNHSYPLRFPINQWDQNKFAIMVEIELKRAKTSKHFFFNNTTRLQILQNFIDNNYFYVEGSYDSSIWGVYDRKTGECGQNLLGAAYEVVMAKLILDGTLKPGKFHERTWVWTSIHEPLVVQQAKLYSQQQAQQQTTHLAIPTTSSNSQPSFPMNTYIQQQQQPVTLLQPSQQFVASTMTPNVSSSSYTTSSYSPSTNEQLLLQQIQQQQQQLMFLQTQLQQLRLSQSLNTSTFQPFTSSTTPVYCNTSSSSSSTSTTYVPSLPIPTQTRRAPDRTNPQNIVAICRFDDETTANTFRNIASIKTQNGNITVNLGANNDYVVVLSDQDYAVLCNYYSNLRPFNQLIDLAQQQQSQTPSLLMLSTLPTPTTQQQMLAQQWQLRSTNGGYNNLSQQRSTQPFAKYRVPNADGSSTEIIQFRFAANAYNAAQKLARTNRHPNHPKNITQESDGTYTINFPKTDRPDFGGGYDKLPVEYTSGQSFNSVPTKAEAFKQAPLRSMTF